MKRYAIVKVDYKCPVMLEEKLKVCLSGHSCYHTEKCPYQWGDTKWQLIAKVKQAIQIGYNKGIILSDTMAKFIVEFLGVSE